MTIQCISCGKFIPYADMESGMALFHHEPDSDRGREVNEWTCHACGKRDAERRDDETEAFLAGEAAL